MIYKTPLVLSALVALAACSPQPAEDAVPGDSVDVSSSATPPAPSPTVEAGSAETPGEDLSAPMLTPEAEKGEKGARNILFEWARALESKDFDRAYAQWGDGGKRSGMSREAYARQFAQYDRITVAIGLGTVEGAAGSLYYQVPVTLTGVTASGETETLQGPVTVRRVNDVDGASAAQLRWHIETAKLEPSGE